MPHSVQLNQALPLLVIGLFLLAGYLAHVIGRRAHVPRVTLLLLLGVVGGPHVLGLVPERAEEWFPLATHIALSVVGFMLGERFLGKSLRQLGGVVLSVSIAVTLITAAIVFVGLWALGVDLGLALILAAIAPATAPAATVDVVRESRSAGKLTTTVLAVVAVDDAFGIILFTLAIAGLEAAGAGGLSFAALGMGVWELVGAIIVGIALGLPMAWITGRLRPGELTLVEALGFVLLCGGLATLIGASYLLSCIVMGTVVANRARHHTRPFHAIEGVSQLPLIVFFILAGIKFEPREFVAFGAIGAGYVVFRAIGRVVGGYAGAVAVKAPAVVTRYVGWCLLPQAGVALGLGLMAAERFPEHGRSILVILVATTFLFEVLGPIVTRVALSRSGESGQVPESVGERSSRSLLGSSDYR